MSPRGDESAQSDQDEAEGLRGQKVSVPGGRVAIGVAKEAFYGYAIFVDRGVWNKLDEEVQDACVDAGLITLKGAAAASVALTVRSIGEAPPVPRKRRARRGSRRQEGRPSSEARRHVLQVRREGRSLLGLSRGYFADKHLERRAHLAQRFKTRTRSDGRGLPEDAAASPRSAARELVHEDGAVSPRRQISPVTTSSRPANATSCPSARRPATASSSCRDRSTGASPAKL